jgi:hypothetical protein
MKFFMIPALVTPIEHSCVAILSSEVLLLNFGFITGNMAQSPQLIIRSFKEHHIQPAKNKQIA